ncbi:MAG TPA: nuclear transport factor 2 family protein [Patescibacteria group bacterium]|nr:nuclear transport factor 2 family protein [Patescibacteria group bacterium]
MNCRRIGLCCLLLIPASLWAAGPRRTRHAQAPGPPAQLFPLTPAQQINSLISHMLAAWQIGDISLLHRYYADDAAFVSGLDQPVIQGWSNYLADYQAQRRRVQSGQIIRRNTFVQIHGDVAWACYQWEFGGLIDGRPADFRGHTTLIFESSGAKWLIVFNHTSLDAAARAGSPGAAGAPATGR